MQSKPQALTIKLAWLVGDVGLLCCSLRFCLMFYVSVSPPAAHGQDDGAGPSAHHHLPGSDGPGGSQRQGRRGGGGSCMYSTPRAFGRRFYPKPLTISTLDRRKRNNISLSVKYCMICIYSVYTVYVFLLVLGIKRIQINSTFSNRWRNVYKIHRILKYGHCMVQ